MRIDDDASGCPTMLTIAAAIDVAAFLLAWWLLGFLVAAGIFIVAHVGIFLLLLWRHPEARWR